MANCLVTKLKESVANEGLNVLNHLNISFTSNQNSTFFITYSSVRDITYNLKGVTDSQGNNSGTVRGSNITLALSAGNGRAILSDKYDIYRIYFTGAWTDYDLSDVCCIDTLNALNLPRLSNFKSLSSVLPVLDSCPNISILSCSDSTSRYDNAVAFEDFIKYPKLKRLLIEERMVAGDLALLTNLEFLDNYMGTGSNKTLNTWSSRPTTAPILGGIYYLKNDLDTMLINQANCQPSSESDNRSINVEGDCSFSSEVKTAIAAIKAKGYTVTINGVAQ